MSEAKTEEATPRQESRTRERGRAWQSRDLALGAVLAACGGLLHAGSDAMRVSLERLFTQSFDDLSGAFAPRVAIERALFAGVSLTLPLLALAVAIGALVSAVQVRGLFAPGAIAPDASRLDPSARSGSAARMASTFALGLARLASLLAITVATLAQALPGLATLSRQPPSAALDACFVMASTLTLRMGAALLAFGVLDAIVERALFRASIRMTRREREREQRDAEGDAHLRRERERAREELHREGDLDETRSAALVVTGDDLAIALAYDAADPDAVPRVVTIARSRIDELVAEASAAGVPRVEDDALAAQLAIVAAGASIPERLYEPVARAMQRGARP